jgi:hypothetical protein
MGERFPAAFHSGQQALFLFNHTADHNAISDGFAFLNTFPRTTSTLNTARRSSTRSVAGTAGVAHLLSLRWSPPPKLTIYECRRRAQLCIKTPRGANL